MRKSKQVECKKCGVNFTAFLDHGKWPKFCCRECFLDFGLRSKAIPCEFCGIEFLAKKSTHTNDLKKFCSKSCYSKSMVKRIDVNCFICETVISVQPSRANGRITCSAECLKILQTTKTLTDETKQKLSESLKNKWSSGERKKNPLETGIKISVSLKKAHAEGRMHKITPEASAKGLANRDMDKVRAAARATGKARLGVEMNGRGAKSPDHHSARYWIVRNKGLGVTLEGWNLSHLVRTNTKYFNEKDIIWNKHQCAASNGLASLFYIKKKTGKPHAQSWKGWSAVDVADHEIIQAN